jgi:hypothetical protein
MLSFADQWWLCIAAGAAGNLTASEEQEQSPSEIFRRVFLLKISARGDARPTANLRYEHGSNGKAIG